MTVTRTRTGPDQTGDWLRVLDVHVPFLVRAPFRLRRLRESWFDEQLFKPLDLDVLEEILAHIGEPHRADGSSS
jgi:hypothetical protein